MKNYGDNAEKVAEGIQDVSPPDSTTTVHADLKNLSHGQTLDKEGEFIFVLKQNLKIEVVYIFSRIKSAKCVLIYQSA